MTQKNQIEKFLRTHKKGITPLQAYEKFGIMRLSAIIFNLKNDDGLNIVTDMIPVSNRNGKKKHVACYRLVEGNK